MLSARGMSVAIATGLLATQCSVPRSRTPVALVCPETCANAFQPHLDSSAALGCFVSMAPVFLGIHWGMTFNQAADRVAERKLRLQREYDMCLRGEGCPIRYEEAKVAHDDAQLLLEDARRFQLAGATRTVVTQRLLPQLSSLSFRRRSQAAPFMQTEGTEAPADDATASSSAGAESLNEKMAAWEATEEEARANTLGGNLPLIGMPGLPGRMTRTDQPTKIDGFDLGMNLSGLILFPLAIALFSVPFWIGNIDVSDVGPPPMS